MTALSPMQTLWNVAAIGKKGGFQSFVAAASRLERKDQSRRSKSAVFELCYKLLQGLPEP